MFSTVEVLQEFAAAARLGERRYRPRWDAGFHMIKRYDRLKQAQYRRTYMAKVRANPLKLAAYKKRYAEYRKTYMARLKADPDRYAAYKASRRKAK